MPTYTYECPKCEKRLELVQKISEKQAPLCDTCSDDAGNYLQMETVITGTSFSLKGVGWARDGYDKVMK